MLHPKKRHALPYAESKHTNRTNGEVRQNEDLTGDKSLTEEGFPLSKISRPDLKVLLEKLERLNQEHVSLEYKLRKLQSGDSKGGNAKSAAQLQRTREQLDQKQMEFKKAKEEWEQFKQDSGQLTTAESQEKYKGRNDLLQYLNRIIRAPKPSKLVIYAHSFPLKLLTLVFQKFCKFDSIASKCLVQLYKNFVLGL